MIALHGPTHGPDYWRDLLRLTVPRPSSASQITPRRTWQQVQRPVLVIQGENDRVNAPARHAQFIARHIPYAELWIPAGVGTYRPPRNAASSGWNGSNPSWIAAAMRLNDALYRLEKERYADGREWIYDCARRPTRQIRAGSRCRGTGAARRPSARRPLSGWQTGCRPRAWKRRSMRQQCRSLLDETPPGRWSTGR